MEVIKRFGSKLLFIFFTYLLGSEFSWSISALICYISSLTGNECILYRNLTSIVVSLSLYLILVVVIFLSAKKLKNNNHFLYLLFKPNKIKVVFTVIILLVWIFLSFEGGKSSLYYVNPADSLVYSSLGSPLFTTLAFLGTFFILYPFSSVIATMFSLIHDESENLNKKIVIYMLCVIIFNPLSLLTGYLESGKIFQYLRINYQNLDMCGAKIVSVVPGSPANKTGLIAGELIKKINNHPVIDIKEVASLLSPNLDGKPLTVETNNGIYLLPIRFNSSGKSPDPGFAFEQGYCRQQ